MLEVSRYSTNREQNNVLSVGEGKKSKKCHICFTEHVKHLKIFRCTRYVRFSNTLGDYVSLQIVVRQHA